MSAVGAEMALVAALSAGLAYLVALRVLAHAPRLGLVQAPTTRSSHKRPTPHGGGIGIVAVGGVASLALGACYAAEASWWIGVAGALALALVGLRDDLESLSRRVRLIAQGLSCLAMIVAIAPPPLQLAPGWTWAGPLFWAALWLVLIGWVNLFNFMDGIDGLAASQAAFMAGAALALSQLVEAPSPPLLVLALAATLGACLGFLLLNWPPAVMFMGDVGSIYLGFTLAFLGLLSIAAGVLSYPVWAILGAAFIADATVTFAVRLARGRRPGEAHRSHAYQRLARRWGDHRPSTLLFIAINLGWLAPLATAATLWPELAWRLTALAYAPLVIGALLVGAGRSDDG